MKRIKVDLPKEIDTLKIIVLADLHIGEFHTDMKLVKDLINMVANDPNMYAILNGDIINNATKGSVSDIYSESMPPMEQLKYALSLLKPIKDKILCINNGNHERRTMRGDGIDLMSIAATELGLEDRFSNEAALLFLRFGKQSKDNHNRPVLYTFYATHGSRGGRKVGGKINALVELKGIVDTDIYIHSHTHTPAIIREGFYRVSQITSSYEFVDKLFVNNGATIKYGGYGENFNYLPSSLKYPIIYLNGKKKEYTAVV